MKKLIALALLFAAAGTAQALFKRAELSDLDTFMKKYAKNVTYDNTLNTLTFTTAPMLATGTPGPTNPFTLFTNELNNLPEYVIQKKYAAQKKSSLAGGRTRFTVTLTLTPDAYSVFTGETGPMPSAAHAQQ
ncbi:hypothetical protein CVU75_03085 [Candidatus Dependentiae bacterium HGW-Dependentiae-1]|nr:MAG: hypothetical protein CVU75_03085 [Candidatus Dependentiae bacterium HGW-Dependentiae-1]